MERQTSKTTLILPRSEVMDTTPFDVTEYDSDESAAAEADRYEEVFSALTAPINEERPWMVFGACREADANIFFPTNKEQTRAALAICATCPVEQDCLEYALDARERFGVWGGTTEKQRRKLLRRTA
ncbi:MAG: WhiB family transcriptional regulator [Acidimicrobiia bacterium]